MLASTRWRYERWSQAEIRPATHVNRCSLSVGVRCSRRHDSTSWILMRPRRAVAVGGGRTPSVARLRAVSAFLACSRSRRRGAGRV